MHLFLIGLPGAGKSTAAKALAEAWGWPLCDLDVWIEEDAGCSIAELIEADGGEVFNVDGDNELTVMAIPLETADNHKHSHAFDLSTDVVSLRS